MSIPVTPETKLKKPLSLILMGETVQLFHHEKGSSHCCVEFADGKSRVAALCDLDYSDKKKFGSSISSKPKPSKPEDISDKKLLDAFFLEMGKRVPFNCQNCRKPLYAFSKSQQRASTAHILPKKEDMFPELATDPDNVLFMGVYQFGASCGDHTDWDSSVEKRVKMPIYPIALKKYNEKLRPQLSEAKQILGDEYMGIISKSQNLLQDIQNGKL